MTETAITPATLLVVEDDRKLVRALERGLEREGYEVDVAYTGEEALERVRARAYDAVVLDVMLPGADGFEVCEVMRREQRTLPVLMLTARAEVAELRTSQDQLVAERVEARAQLALAQEEIARLQKQVEQLQAKASVTGSVRAPTPSGTPARSSARPQGTRR